MFNKEWRLQTWGELNQPWDVLIIGGGITGAGVLLHSAAAGLKALLVEANDFSSGTSSRSSKLIHGGLRYILNKQYKVTQESVRERERLMKEAPDLVTKLGFIFPNFTSYHATSRQISVVIGIYDLLAPKWDHFKLSPKKVLQECPELVSDGLMGGYLYYDAAMDDSRVVLRVLKEAVKAGGTALNYVKAEKLLRDNSGRVCGSVLKDMSNPEGKDVQVKARVVVNAAGPWADQLRGQIGQPARLRRVRGSHIIFPFEKLPMREALTLLHPHDKRAMFVIPWEGTIILGTTEVDQDTKLDETHAEPFMSVDEAGYMMEAANALFPGVKLSISDAISSFSGLRPIIAGGADTASKESRAHALWEEEGMVTITGGKYTTFRIMSRQAVMAVLKQLNRPLSIKRKRVFPRVKDTTAPNIAAGTLAYLSGRYGEDTRGLINGAGAGDLERIGTLPNVWAELRWAAKNEAVVHLDDLLLRRVRLGMLLPDGAREHLERIRSITQAALDWSDQRWQQEAQSYLNTWQRYYSPRPG